MRRKIVSGREYKNMCLSLQSPQLRRDLHEKTKTCFRGVSLSSTSRRAFAASVASLLSLSHNHAHSLCTQTHTHLHKIAQWSVRARRKEKLAQRDSLSRGGTLHFTIAKILCKASVHAQARSRTRPSTRRSDRVACT